MHDRRLPHPHRLGGLWQLGTFVVLLATLAGCTFDDSKLIDRQCRGDNECDMAGFICVDGYCQEGVRPEPDVGPDIEMDTNMPDVEQCVDDDGDGFFAMTPGCDAEEYDCDDNGLNAAARFPGNMEICDGVDNDCDGTTDEREELTDIPLCDNQEGACAGATKRCQGGRYVPCTADDFTSNNADYRTEESFCPDGVDSDTGLCNDSADPNRPELCDDVDNDCDGSTDEQMEFRCYTGEIATLNTNSMATCAPGVIACEGGQYVADTAACEGEVLPIDDESGAAVVCDQLDNNCDGQTDEQCECTMDVACFTLGDGCTVDGQDASCTGTCVAGTLPCTDGSFGSCMDQVGPEDETCANQAFDNNCDGTVDNINGRTLGEDCTPTDDEGTELLGECLEDGEGNHATFVCDGDAADSPVICQALAQPQQELCPDLGTDNDCDGRRFDLLYLDTSAGIDNGVLMEATSSSEIINTMCLTGQPGVCEMGVYTCEGQDGPARCMPTSEEIIPQDAGQDNACNSDEGVVDADCDGDIGEDNLKNTTIHCGACNSPCDSGDSCCPVDGDPSHSCFDLQTNLNRCGDCNIDCADVVGADACCAGSCTNTNTNTENCGECGNSCTDQLGPDSGCCDGGCADFSEPATCGACGRNCGTLLGEEIGNVLCCPDGADPTGFSCALATDGCP